MFRLLAIPVAALAIFASPCVPQQPACESVEIRVGAILGDGRVLRGLHAEHLNVQAGKYSLRIESVAQDTGPRRIVFVLDMSRDLTADARKAEVMAALHILRSARSEDSFALLTARGVLREVRFGESRERLAETFNELAGEPQGPRSPHSVADAILEGIRWLGDPGPGNAVLVFAEGIEGQGGASHAAVGKALAEHRVRLFGMQIGPILLGYDSSYLLRDPTGQMTILGGFIPNRKDLSALAFKSGGYLVLENTMHPQKQFKLTDPVRERWQQAAWRLYGAIVELYRVRVHLPSPAQKEALKVDLSEKVGQKFPRSTALYQHDFRLCPAVE